MQPLWGVGVDTPMTNRHDKVLIVLDQDDVDTAIHAIEQAGVELDEDTFREEYGTVYKKLHAIDQDSDDGYRVK